MRTPTNPRPDIPVSYTDFNPQFFVYALCDPPTNDNPVGNIRYIGKSCKGLLRPVEHFVPSSLRVKNKKNSWIKSLYKQDKVPNLIILQVCDSAESVAQAEINLIRICKENGANLTNMTEGGTGGNTGGGLPKKPVVAINIQTKESKQYPSVHSTAEDGFSPTKVSAVCRGKRRTHKNHFFAYNPVNPPHIIEL